jgi:hypothetical protein
VAYTGQKLADGSYTVTAKSTDVAGNTSTGTAPKTLVIYTAGDPGSFTVAGAKTINGQLSTSSKTPTLTLSFTDPVGLWTMQVSTDGGASFGTAQAYATSVGVTLGAGDGIYTVEIRVVDVAGNAETSTLTVRLDTTGPAVSASLSPGQISALQYDGTANITGSYTATDISNVTSLTATLDGIAFTGSVINVYSLTAGSTHTLAITAVDGLGNTTTVSIAFVIHPSLTGVEDAVKAGFSAGGMSSTEETTLLAYLTNASNPVKTDLTNFINAVKAQSGTKSLTAAEATLLTSWAQDLYNRS